MRTPAARLRSALAASPLRDPTFRLFYVGVVGAAIGYTMQATVSSWLMATLTPSVLMVALVQTASTAPTLLFGLIAGALSDIADRRRVMLATQLVMVSCVAVLGGAALAGFIGPISLLVLTFVVGCGFTFFLPAQQASVHSFVARDELPRAIALSAVAFNVARAAGPALAGAIAAWLGSGSALLASALFFIAMIVALRRWQPRERPLPGVPERVLSGVRSGLRYARNSPAMRAFLIRCTSFSVCASAFWALLPVVARDLLGLGADGFGLLSAAFGAGAIVGAWSIARQLKRTSLNALITFGVLTWSGAVALMVAATHTPIAVACACGAGAAWVLVLASLSAGIQSTAPAWVRARAASMYLVATQASLAVGSMAWGAFATAIGIRVALGASVAVMLLLHLFDRRLRVELGSDADVMPRVQVPDLAVAFEPLPDDGPVLIQIDYRIEPHNRRAFVAAIGSVGPIRRRTGATSWRVFRDLGDEERFVERYVVASWADYLRQRMRVTLADSELQQRVAELQRADVPIRVSRLIGVDAGSTPADAADVQPM